MYKLAIFDLDGTLLNTIDDLADACNYALQSQGFPEHTADAYKQFVGNGAHNLILRAMPPAYRDTAATGKVEAVFHAQYADHAQDKTWPYPGIISALTALRVAEVRVAVLSNKPDTYTGKLVEQYFPGLADVVFGQRDGVPIKPDPTAVEEILHIMGCDPGDAVYIGDTGVDIQTGRAAGMDTIGVAWGFRTREELETNGASVIIDKTEDLIKIIVDNQITA